MRKPPQPDFGARPDRAPREREVQIAAGEVTLHGTLTLSEGARGLVLFAHGSGSGRFSSRNRRVAAELVAGGLATLLFDLLAAHEEEEDARRSPLRFHVELLAGRLLHAAHWTRHEPEIAELPLDYFGASTGAAAALIAAAREPQLVSAIVSRGGRPDLAGNALAAVRAPTLLIVGSNDDAVLQLNEEALDRLRCEKHLEIIGGASHLFEEPGTLDIVAQLASSWFLMHLSHPTPHPERTR